MCKYQEAAITLYRIRHPKARRTNLVGITHSGGSRRVYQCGGCGAWISMCARWPMTRRVAEFIAAHNHDCAIKLCRANGVAVEESHV